MTKFRFAHRNNCPRCPIIGAEDIPGEEYFELWGMRFSVAVARHLAASHPLQKVGPADLDRWLGWAHIEKCHLDHVPAEKGFGILITLPNGIGTPMIDGNHRTLAALIDRNTFSVVILDEEETLELLRRSMGPELAAKYWQDLKGLSAPRQKQAN